MEIRDREIYELYDGKTLYTASINDLDVSNVKKHKEDNIINNHKKNISAGFVLQ